VQRGSKIDLMGGLADGGERQGCGANFCAYSALFANVSKVGGEAVADVDHSGGQAPLAQELSDSDAGLRMKMLGEVCRTKFAVGDEQFQSSRRTSEITGHIDAIAGFRARAQYSIARRTGPDDDDISEDSARRLSNVASGEGHLKRSGLVQQAVEKPANPALRKTSGQG
jgi:hypothetical protein